MKMKITDYEVQEKKVWVRTDFNVPIENDFIKDDLRIKASLPTIEYLIQKKARIILASHLGKPGGKVVESLRMNPVAKRLSAFLNQEVQKVDYCVGLEVEQAIDNLFPGEVLLLENLRFYAEEENNDAAFAKALANQAEIYVNDAFGASHRSHASIEGITNYVDKTAVGFLIEKEIEVLNHILDTPKRPVISVLGGAKIKDKIKSIYQLIEFSDWLLIGGGIANTFLAALGMQMGDSFVEKESVDKAQEILKKANEKLVLPLDGLVVDRIAEDANQKSITADKIPDGWKMVDIGPETIYLFNSKLSQAKTVIWNGPMGMFEIEPFSKGTSEVCKTIATLDAVSVAGGGDTIFAIQKNKMSSRFSHLSTGGGAFLKFLGGENLPGISSIKDREVYSTL